MLKKEALRDVRSTTGANMRGIMLLTNKKSLDKMSRDCVKKMDYYKVNEQDIWKVSIAADAYQVSNVKMEIELFDQREMAAVPTSAAPEGASSSSCTTAARRTAHKLFFSAGSSPPISLLFSLN